MVEEGRVCFGAQVRGELMSPSNNVNMSFPATNHQGHK
jgi:hypothetical protein